MCSVIKGHEDDFYVCPTTSDDEMLCIATVSWGSYMYGPLNDYDSSGSGSSSSGYGSSTKYCSDSSVDTKVLLCVAFLSSNNLAYAGQMHGGSGLFR